VDLIVSDIQMPNGDGLSLARAVGVSHPAVPIILVSGNAHSEVSGFEFVQKPFSENVLLKAVRNVLGRKSRTACSD
jgi:DNA-binding response OmpR family regulator